MGERSLPISSRVMVEVPNHYSLLLYVSLLLFALPLLEWSGLQDGIYAFSISSQHSLQKEVQESRGVLSDTKDVLHNFFSFMKLNQVSCLLFMCNH